MVTNELMLAIDLFSLIYWVLFGIILMKYYKNQRLIFLNQLIVKMFYKLGTLFWSSQPSFSQKLEIWQ